MAMGICMSEILLVGSSFFGYRDRIAREMQRQGHTVQVVNDRPSESVAFKSVARTVPKLTNGSVSRYSKYLCQLIAGGRFEHVIYMGGMTFLFDRRQVKSMRSAGPNSCFTAYLWDSLANSPKLSESLDLFDRVLSFEPRDCETRGLELRPLFYSDSYSKLTIKAPGDFTYDACFVGSVHQKSKFEAVKRICDGLAERGLRVFTYYYMPSGSVAALRWLTSSAYRSVNLVFEPLSTELVANVYAKSKVVIDSPQASQTGLTMRTLEAVGACRKLVTTNPAVRDYDFCIDENVFVSSGETLPPSSFFASPFVELPPSIYRSYSLATFVMNLLGEGPLFQGYRRSYRCT